MNFRDIDKDAILQNAATFSSSIEVLDTDIVFTEEDSLVDWKLEDFRYVPSNGFIGQFVERLLDGNLVNIPDDVVLENARIKLNLTIHNKLDNSDYTYSYGTFIITKVNKSDVQGKVSYESCDLAKLFNVNYEPQVTFPCTVIDLLNDVCTQVGVKYKVAEDIEYLYTYAVDEPITGILSILIDGVYHNITLPNELTLYDSIFYIPQYNTALIRSHIDNDTSIVTVNASITSVAQGVLIEANKVPFPQQDFPNLSFVVDGNHFENTLCRDVIKAISKLFYSSVRIGWDDELYFDVYDGSLAEVDDYHIIDVDHHYGSVSSDAKFGPVNKVVVGLSNVSGENVYYPAEIEGDQITEIGIWDNPITYTEQLRRLSLYAEPPMIGLNYIPVSLKTTGHPWLEANEIIQIEDADGNIFKTYPFDRTLTYKGFITSEISSKGTNSKSDRDYNYDNSIEQRVSRAEITVNKSTGEIKNVTQSVEQLTGEINNLSGDIANQYQEIIGELNNSVSKDDIFELEKTVTQLQTDSYTKTEINKIITGSYTDASGNLVAVTKVQTDSATYDENGMRYERKDAPTSSTINHKGFEVDDSDKNDLLYAGYVDDAKISQNQRLQDFKGQSVVYTQNAIVDNYLITGSYSRTEDYEEEVEQDDGSIKTKKGTGVFYLGG